MKPINEQINPNFVIQAKKLARYTQLLRNILPIECHNHVQVANIRNHSLMLMTDSPVWTTRLRQLSPQILQFIRENTQDVDQRASTKKDNELIHHVQISTRYHTAASNTAENKITPANGETLSIAGDKPAGTSRAKLEISDNTAELLTQSADSIEHPQLKAALLKIASHKKPVD
jgi:hypothetical protein